MSARRAICNDVYSQYYNILFSIITNENTKIKNLLQKTKDDLHVACLKLRHKNCAILLLYHHRLPQVIASHHTKKKVGIFFLGLSMYMIFDQEVIYPSSDTTRGVSLFVSTEKTKVGFGWMG